jgi:hypothetical protein
VWLKGLGAAQCEFFSTTTSMCGSWLEAKLLILGHTIDQKQREGNVVVL